MPAPLPDPDQVVLVDDAGCAVGTAPRATVHDDRTPLHLAFSCYVFSPAGRLLMTRRALGKATWPGVWTNSVCGHPQPGERPRDAVRRRARDELGLRLVDLELLLPSFRYRAVDASGVVEHELCPVWFAATTDEPVPDPAEVVETRWVDPEDLGRATAAAPWAFSPWLVEQLSELVRVGPAPARAALVDAC